MGSRSARPLLLACTALVAVSAILPAHAQDATTTTPAANGDETQLQTIVVKGKRVPAGSVADTPTATTTDSTKLDQAQVGDLRDFGNTIDPSVTYEKLGKSVNVRGMNKDRVLTTIDGIPIPYFYDSAWGGTLPGGVGGGADTFDVNSLSSVSIMKSADSSRAGSGALGGAVVMQSLGPDDLLQDGKTIGGQAKLGYDGSDNSWVTSGAVAKRIENTSVMFQGTYKKGHEQENKGEVGGIGSTRTIADPADYNQRNLLFKLRQDLEGGHNIGVTAEHYDSNSRTHFLSYSSSTYDRLQSYLPLNTDRARLSVDYKFEAPSEDGWIDSAFATFYVQRSFRESGIDTYRPTSPPIGDYVRIVENMERDYGYNAWMNGSIETGALHHQFSLGSDFQFGQTSTYQETEDSCGTSTSGVCAYPHDESLAPDVNTYKFGLFAEDKISVGDSPVSLTPGLRFDWYRHDPQETATYEEEVGNSSSDMQISPKLRAAWQVNPDTLVYAQFVTAFKAPSAYQSYSTFDSGSYIVYGNPDLKPETSYGFEGGVNYGDADTGANLSVFSTQYKNYIDLMTLSSAPSGYYFAQGYINRANVRISGVTAEAHKTFDNGINLHGSLSYLYGIDEDENLRLGTVPPVKAIMGIGYERESWGTDLSLVLSGALPDNVESTADRNSAGTPNTLEVAGYGVVNLTAWWEPEQAENLRITAGAYNLFDKKYFDALEVVKAASTSDLYSEPGRYFKVSLTQKF